MAHTFTSFVTSLFDALLAPFGAHATFALAVVSLVCGVLMIFLFRATSNQARIRRTRDLLKARILEMRIYQDDLQQILRALAAALWTNVTYLRVIWKSLVLIGALVVIVFVQLDARFGHAPLRPNETATLTVALPEGRAERMPLSIETGAGAKVDSPPVFAAATHEVSWRLRAIESGTHTVSLTAGEEVYRFDLAAAPSTRAIGQARGRTLADALLNAGLPTLPAGFPAEAVSIRYPAASHALFGWRANWLVVFVVWSLIGALLPKLIFRIEV